MRKLVFGMILISLVLGTIIPLMSGATEDERVIRIIDAKTGSASTILGNEIEPLPTKGYAFTLNVTLDGLTNYLFQYQVALKFDKDNVKCTNAWINLYDPNFVFYNESFMMVSVSTYNDLGFVALSAKLRTDYAIPDRQEIHHYVNVSYGLLCQFNFTAISTGNSTIEVIQTDNPNYYFTTFLLDKDEQHISFNSENFDLTVLGQSIPSTKVRIYPCALNLRSRGKWIMALIRLPEGYDANDVNVSSILLNGTIPVELKPIKIGCSANVTSYLLVKFGRVEVISYILSNIHKHRRFMTITLTVNGKLIDGTWFEGSDRVKVTLQIPRRHVPNCHR